MKLYLEFAASRLKVAEERLSGKESEPGDPFEFFTPEDMLDGYYRILESVMLNLEDAYQKNDAMEHGKVQRALKTLKEAMESALKQLEILKTIAEEKNKEEFWDLVNKAIDISKGALEGANPASPRIRSRQQETQKVGPRITPKPRMSGSASLSGSASMIAIAIGFSSEYLDTQLEKSRSR